MATLEGKLAFENLSSKEVYKGKCTGRYSVVLSLEDDVAERLKTEGVILREYEGTPQRKFASKFDVPIFDEYGNAWHDDTIGRGSKVRVLYTLSDPHPTHGVVPFLNKIKVLEMAEDSGDF